MVKPVLPRGALNSISFVDKPAQLEVFFDLDRVPKSYGGRSDFEFGVKSSNPLLDYYSSHSIGSVDAQDHKISRVGSLESVADIFHSARGSLSATPLGSRQPSMHDLLAPRDGRRSRRAPSPLSIPAKGHESELYPKENGKAVEEPPPSLTPLQRIRSLADFRLYLSPSRLAQVDALADSSDEEEVSEPPPRRTLQPALVGQMTQVARPGIPRQLSNGVEVAYAERLSRHHAEGLNRLDSGSVAVIPTKGNVQTKLGLIEAPQTASRRTAREEPSSTVRISPYSRSSNPYYGYPVVRVPSRSHPGVTHIEPAYHRRRKRDLVKTLMFLFLLRLQSLRDTIERKLGLNRLIPWVGGAVHPWYKVNNPSEGLLRTAESGTTAKNSVVIKRNWESDRVWMIIGFMLMRGTWTRLLATPLETLGSWSIRGLLGPA